MQIYLICKIDRNDKRKYQREKIKLWHLTQKQISPRVTKAPFVNREWGEFYYGEFINYLQK